MRSPSTSWTPSFATAGRQHSPRLAFPRSSFVSFIFVEPTMPVTAKLLTLRTTRSLVTSDANHLKLALVSKEGPGTTAALNTGDTKDNNTREHSDSSVIEMTKNSEQLPPVIYFQQAVHFRHDRRSAGRMTHISPCPDLPFPVPRIQGLIMMTDYQDIPSMSRAITNMHTSDCQGMHPWQLGSLISYYRVRCKALIRRAQRCK